MKWNFIKERNERGAKRDTYHIGNSGFGIVCMKAWSWMGMERIKGEQRNEGIKLILVALMVHVFLSYFIIK